MSTKTVPAAIVNDIRRLTREVRAELRLTATDPHLSQAVADLADALDACAEMLDYHQEFLVSLRNWRADAS